jgi:hypothetical protein
MWYTFAPKGKIVRTDFVDDGVYKGYWVWLIVESGDTEFKKQEFTWLKTSTDIYPERVQLGIMPEQRVEIEGTIFNNLVSFENGMIWLNYDLSEKDDADRVKTYYKIVGYKTGEEFNIHPQNLFYLGYAAIIIKNEIAVYFFEVAG